MPRNASLRPAQDMPPACTDSSVLMTYAKRVDATQAALDLIEVLRAEHGPLMFHQSGGCCDGSSPMCFPLGDIIVGDSDVLLGEIGGAPFYMSAAQFDYWQHTKLMIDVVPGRGGMFSLENGHGVRFLTRSSMFDDEELERLHPVTPGSVAFTPGG